MPNTLLVVDGRGHPRELTQRLASLGYTCLYARGPLRARTLLTQHTVDLILWKDNSASAGLSADLLAEWRLYPRIPVVRLYGKGAVVPLGIAPGDFSAAVTANLPAELPEYQLFTALSRCLTGGLVPGGLRAGNELAFRHVLASLRQHAGGSRADGHTPVPDADLADTGLSVSERELLREVGSPASAYPLHKPNPLRSVLTRWREALRTRWAS